MNDKHWGCFSDLRNAYKQYIEKLSIELPDLGCFQQELINTRPDGGYKVETPLVYNRALEDITPDHDIKLIIVADNPGRREQEAKNRRYLTGPSGKLADAFFKAHPELGIDFKQAVLILNKTPIHTPRTLELKELVKLGGRRIADALVSSQKEMANLAYLFHKELSLEGQALPLWIVGYSELGASGLFRPYAEALSAYYKEASGNLRDSIGLFRHFSMNQFLVDYRKQALRGEKTDSTLFRIGSAYRKKYFGW